MNTSTLSNPYWREMRAAVAHAMPHLVWRRHGIGALQAYLSEGTNPEVRVHIWHPKLQTSGMGFPRNVHTHRFDLRSTVLCGVLKQTEFSMGRSDYGGFDIYEVTHARKQGKDELPTRFDGFAYELSGRQVLYPAGSAYFFPRGAFHSTAVDELTVDGDREARPEQRREGAHHLARRRAAHAWLHRAADHQGDRRDGRRGGRDPPEADPVNVATLTITNCVDCPFHRVQRDPDPFDSFCSDDVKVVCTKARVARVVTVACRPYNIREECEVPKWCPLLKRKGKKS